MESILCISSHGELIYTNTIRMEYFNTTCIQQVPAGLDSAPVVFLKECTYSSSPQHAPSYSGSQHGMCLNRLLSASLGHTRAPVLLGMECIPTGLGNSAFIWVSVGRNEATLALHSMECSRLQLYSEDKIHLQLSLWWKLPIPCLLRMESVYFSPPQEGMRLLGSPQHGMKHVAALFRR
ncbi:uncharacterized protein [Dipodomys merriami]|uniref:uncharacterized protein isoform X2 n=1 Tax=Dipodomys merriami TaxID=94247 RepID=UPI0038514281